MFAVLCLSASLFAKAIWCANNIPIHTHKTPNSYGKLDTDLSNNIIQKNVRQHKKTYFFCQKNIRIGNICILYISSYVSILNTEWNIIGEEMTLQSWYNTFMDLFKIYYTFNTPSLHIENPHKKWFDIHMELFHAYMLFNKMIYTNT